MRTVAGIASRIVTPVRKSVRMCTRMYACVHINIYIHSEWNSKGTLHRILNSKLRAQRASRIGRGLEFMAQGDRTDVQC